MPRSRRHNLSGAAAFRRDTAGIHRGLATVEIAVCLPTLVFVLFAALQAADGIFLKQSLQVASYEAARTAIKRKGTNSEAKSAGEEILNYRNVQAYTINILPGDVTMAERGSVVSVTVTASTNSNTLLYDWLPLGENLTVTTKMVKE